MENLVELVSSITEFDMLANEKYGVYSREWIEVDFLSKLEGFTQANSGDEIYAVLVQDRESCVIADDLLTDFQGPFSIIAAGGLLLCERSNGDLNLDNFQSWGSEDVIYDIWQFVDDEKNTNICFGDKTDNTFFPGACFNLGNCDSSLYVDELNAAKQILSEINSNKIQPVLSSEKDNFSTSDSSKLSLYERVKAVINRYEDLYNENEFHLQVYMASIWGDAFKYAAECEGEEYDESFPPPITITADLSAEKIINPDDFVEQLEGMLERLKNGYPIPRNS